MQAGATCCHLGGEPSIQDGGRRGWADPKTWSSEARRENGKLRAGAGLGPARGAGAMQGAQQSLGARLRAAHTLLGQEGQGEQPDMRLMPHHPK